MSALRRHHKRQLEERMLVGAGWQESGLVFVRPDGELLHPQTLTYLFEKRAKVAGLRPIRLHDIRHSYATAALMAGVHPKIVSERLGHSSIAITLDTYSHVIEGMQEDAASTVADLILGNGPARSRDQSVTKAGETPP